MSVTTIKSEINEKKELIKSKQSEINDLQNQILGLEKKLKLHEEESLMDFIKEGDEYEIDGYVALGRKVSLGKHDCFKITKVNRKSLYMKVTKKYKVSWGNHSNNYQRSYELLVDSPIYDKEFKITSTVFYNNFKSQIKDQLSQFTQRNDLLDALLDG